MNIQVTQEHIDKGQSLDYMQRGRLGNCPVALALQNQGFPNARVGIRLLYLDTHPTPRHVVETPSAVRRFVDAADDQLPLAPFEFVLDV